MSSSTNKKNQKGEEQGAGGTPLLSVSSSSPAYGSTVLSTTQASQIRQQQPQVIQPYRTGPLHRPVVVDHHHHHVHVEEADLMDSDDDEILLHSKERLLQRADAFDLAFHMERGFRALEMKFCSLKRPHMRAMHASWLCFFASYFVQFSMAPLLPQLKESLDLTKRDIWLTNTVMMVGGIPMRFLLGPLCDSYGPRSVMVWMLTLCAIPCALSGLIVVNLSTLLLVRFVIGAMDAFVPCQCWITSHFVREIGGTIMAIAGGLGASGSGFSNLVLGLVFSVCVIWTGGNEDLAWRIALLFPAAFALLVAYISNYYSDDCPLGNFSDVKKAGLMIERSAADSFRSGVYNLNSWILFLQYAGSCGVDVTMCNGCAVYFNARFNQSIASSGAIAFLYGFSALYARGLGGWCSDRIGDSFSIYGRLWMHFGCMIVQGCLNVWFARDPDLYPSIYIMLAFSVMVQMSMGTCYGLVPYIDSANTGTVAGIVGAGGNVGAVVLGLLFMNEDYDDAMEYMGYFTLVMGLLTPLIVIKGYRGILFGREDMEDKVQYSPLLVPKMQHSPHLVKIKKRYRKPANI